MNFSGHVEHLAWLNLLNCYLQIVVQLICEIWTLLCLHIAHFVFGQKFLPTGSKITFVGFPDLFDSQEIYSQADSQGELNVTKTRGLKHGLDIDCQGGKVNHFLNCKVTNWA